MTTRQLVVAAIVVGLVGILITLETAERFPSRAEIVASVAFAAGAGVVWALLKQSKNDGEG